MVPALNQLVRGLLVGHILPLLLHFLIELGGLCEVPGLDAALVQYHCKEFCRLRKHNLIIALADNWLLGGGLLTRLGVKLQGMH